MSEYAALAGEAFAQVRERFEETLGWLAGAGAGALEHGDLEDQLGERGRGLLRLMFQGQLHLRALREQRRRDVACPGGGHADTGGEGSRQAAGDDVRRGHGEPDRLPGSGPAERDVMDEELTCRRRSTRTGCAGSPLWRLRGFF